MKEPGPIPFIRELCAGKTQSEIEEAEDVFRKFLMISEGIAERMEGEEIDGEK